MAVAVGLAEAAPRAEEEVAVSSSRAVLETLQKRKRARREAASAAGGGAGGGGAGDSYIQLDPLSIRLARKEQVPKAAATHIELLAAAASSSVTDVTRARFILLCLMISL